MTLESPQPPQEKPLKTSGELAKSLGMEKDSDAWLPLDPAYKRAFTTPQREGWEKLHVQILRGKPAQRFFVSSAMTNGWHSREYEIDMIRIDTEYVAALAKKLNVDVAKKLGGVLLSETSSDILKSGGYNIIAKYIEGMREHGFFAQRLEEVAHIFNLGLQLSSIAAEQAQKAFPQYPHLENHYPEGGSVYLVGDSQAGKKSIPMIHIEVSPRGARLYQGRANPSTNPDELVDISTFHRFPRKMSDDYRLFGPDDPLPEVHSPEELERFRELLKQGLKTPNFRPTPY